MQGPLCAPGIYYRRRRCPALYIWSLPTRIMRTFQTAIHVLDLFFDWYDREYGSRWPYIDVRDFIKDNIWIKRFMREHNWTVPRSLWIITGSIEKNGQRWAFWSVDLDLQSVTVEGCAFNADCIDYLMALGVFFQTTDIDDWVVGIPVDFIEENLHKINYLCKYRGIDYRIHISHLLIPQVLRNVCPEKSLK